MAVHSRNFCVADDFWGFSLRESTRIINILLWLIAPESHCSYISGGFSIVPTRNSDAPTRYFELISYNSSLCGESVCMIRFS